VRFLYIALAIGALGGPPAARAQTVDSCSGAILGTPCPDDDDPCTADQCDDSGVCRHVDVPNRVTCDPVQDAYRRTLGLRDLVAELTAQLAVVELPGTARVVVDDALGGATSDLRRASDALAGRIVVPPPGAGETLAQARARAAFGIARVTPPRIRGVSRVLAVPAVRASIGTSVVDLAHRVRFLYRSTNQLKRELRRLQRVSGTFTR
jgi:hypothetical protein